MFDFAFYIPAAIVFVCIFAISAAMFIKAYREGSLQADIRWVRRWIRIQLDYQKSLRNI